jgi:mRNA-degrading endonuclease RelE of RelBE toxin-antitoxin system
MATRRVIDLEPAEADLAEIRRRDSKAHRAITDYIDKYLAEHAELGIPLRGAWEGYRRVHVYNDKYRIIWRDLEPIDDYAGNEGDTIIPVLLVAVGLKNPTTGGTIYDQGPPHST